VCEETPAGAVAEEFWSGHGLAVFVRMRSQFWRFPAALRVGDAFAKTTVRSVLDREVSVSRRHRVAAEERVTTGAGVFDAWRLEIDDTSEGNAPAHSRYLGGAGGGARARCGDRGGSADAGGGAGGGGGLTAAD
jgi:hypothetical protein